MGETVRKLRNDRAGAAIHEFALVVPVLLLLMIGSIDFGRSFYHSVTISNAAGTAAFYGARTLIQSGRSDEISQMARDEARDVGAVTVTNERVCRCPNGAVVDCMSGTCGAYGAPQVYVRCRVEKTFDTLVNLPRIPDLFDIRREAWMRVQ